MFGCACFQGAAPEAGPPKMAEIPPEVQARLGDPKNVEEASIDELKAILKEYYDRSVRERRVLKWNQYYSVAVP